MIVQHIQTPFQIYNASAGSGKTFLLVQKYLSKLLSGRQDEFFNRMMALTFTNKAVFEMKYRILLQLHEIATTDKALDSDPMGKALLKTLSIKTEELQTRAKNSLKAILHDYAAFDVITLDSFTHRVIRTFAKDLGLAYNFEVALDVDGFLETIVDRILDRLGQDHNLTKTLEQFTFEKMDDKGITSWDLKNNLIASAKLLLNENDRVQIQQIARLNEIERKKQQDFLTQRQKALSDELRKLGQEMLICFKENELDASHFLRGTIFERFAKLAKGEFDGFDKGKLYDNMLAGKALYPKKIDQEIQLRIDELSSKIRTYFENALKCYHQWLLVKDIKKQWIPLSLVTSLAQELEAYQNETNTLLLSTFNERIAKEILHQPTPYIYERLGENYRHYFLDEFQDTSSLQWENLIPLIETPLQSLNAENRSGSVLLVGDPKQSIYRWRGGNVDQFMGLIKKDNPFQVPKKLNGLTVNYRSAKNIVAFNNALYKMLPDFLEYEENKSLFGESAQQSQFLSQEGYVKLCFFEEEKEQDENPYIKRIALEINHCLTLGYRLSDMVILVRKKKQADSIAKGLANAQIKTITSSSLKLTESKQVNFLASILLLYNNPSDFLIKKQHLCFLYAIKDRQEDLHRYLLRYLSQDLEKIWEEENIRFAFSYFDHRDLSTVMEKACFSFPTLAIDDPYVCAFMDLIFDFCQKEHADLLSFLRFWETKKEEQGVILPPDSDGVRIMTIHQAKGLEFPIVFFPYADSLIHANHKDRIWLSTHSILGKELPLAWVSYSQRMLNYGAEGEKVYHKKRQDEEMDAWNVFYVATTRASEQFYLYASTKNKNKESYVAVLSDLQPQKESQEANQILYEWGSPCPSKQERDLQSTSKEKSVVKSKSLYPYEQQLILQMSRGEARESARLFGLRTHELLAKITYAEEAENILAEAYLQGEITKKEQQKLLHTFQELLQNKTLGRYYSRAYKVYNEKAILVPNQQIFRPDRVGIGKDDTFVIDYKTGKEQAEHASQVITYAKWMEKITGKKVKVFLIYLNDQAKNHLNVVDLS